MARVITLKTLESRSYSLRLTNVNHMIRSGNAMALDVARPRLAVYRSVN